MPKNRYLQDELNEGTLTHEALVNEVMAQYKDKISDPSAYRKLLEKNIHHYAFLEDIYSHLHQALLIRFFLHNRYSAAELILFSEVHLGVSDILYGDEGEKIWKDLVIRDYGAEASDERQWFGKVTTKEFHVIYGAYKTTMEKTVEMIFDLLIFMQKYFLLDLKIIENYIFLLDWSKLSTDDQIKALSDAQKAYNRLLDYFATERSTEITSCLNLAVSHNHFHLVEQLLSHGANVTANSTGYNNPLITAVLKNNLPIIKILLAQPGINTSFKLAGLTMLEYAEQHQNHELIALIKEHEASSVSFVYLPSRMISRVSETLENISDRVSRYFR